MSYIKEPCFGDYLILFEGLIVTWILHTCKSHKLSESWFQAYRISATVFKEQVQKRCQKSVNFLPCCFNLDARALVQVQGSCCRIGQQ